MDNQEIKKLYRSRTDRIFTGVCGGLGRYLVMDPIILRVLFVFLAFLDGFGILLYVLLAVLIPLEGTVETPTGDFEEKVRQRAQNIKSEANEFAVKVHSQDWRVGRNVIALIIMGIGLFTLFNQFYPMPYINSTVVAAAGLILLGLYIITKK